jgi:iron complex outermembrane receptor protein/vitamin B12 transporter
MTWSKVSYFLVSALMLISAIFAHGSQIQGVITDPLGAVIPHASVELVARGKILTSTPTDSEGNYRLEFKKAERIHLHIEAPTFAAEDTADFYLSGGKETVTRNVFLKPKNVAQEVVVTATGVPVSEAQVGAPVDVLSPMDFRNHLDIQQALPLFPGLQVTETGERGGTTALFIRGGNPNANKVLLDGVPVNDIGGDVEFADLATAGIESLEVLRGPNSVLYGSDALAGVVSLTTRRGSTPLPQLEYSLDGGNFGSHRQEATLSGAWQRFDYFSDFARFDSSNSLPNSKFHNATYAGNLGWSVSPANTLRVTVRRIASGLGLPNALEFYGLPDNGKLQDHDTFLSATYENQANSKWHNLVRYGASRLVSHTDKPSAVGIAIDGSEFGLPVTIRGANGFSATGQAFLSTTDCCPNSSTSTANRDFVYAQTDYRLKSYASLLFGYRYEAERGESRFSSPEFVSNNSVDRRNMSFIMETHGDLRNRIFYSLGGGIEKNAVFGVEATPRLSLAYYPFPSSSGFFGTTKLNFNFGHGIKEPSIFDETNSLFDLLLQQPGGDQLIQKFGIRPIGAERSKSYDLGVEQSVSHHLQVNLMWFHNQFTNEIEFVSSNALPGLGVPPEVVAASGFGATVNSADFRAQGAEAEIRYRISNSILARAGYTYLDARVERSFSDTALVPAINPLFPNIPIGAISPLVGARPFRRAPHSGFVVLTYNHARLSTLFQGSFISRRDDSTFLLSSDLNFGNGLLLPNRNLDSGYQKLDLSGSFRWTNYLSSYVSMENLLSQHYDAAFGFPSLPFTVRAGLKITLGGESWRLR